MLCQLTGLSQTPTTLNHAVMIAQTGQNIIFQPYLNFLPLWSFFFFFPLELVLSFFCEYCFGGMNN